MRHVVAGLAVAWLVGAAVIEAGSYLPVDSEWSLLPTAALFVSSFVAAFGAFFMAPKLTVIRTWPASTLRSLRGLGVAWLIYTAIWFVALFTIPGVPTHCGTLGSPACGHTYVFNNHGALTVTDRAGFIAGVRILVRVFASPTVAAMSIIVAAYWVKGRLVRRGTPPPVGPGDRLGV